MSHIQDAIQPGVERGDPASSSSVVVLEVRTITDHAHERLSRALEVRKSGGLLEGWGATREASGALYQCLLAEGRLGVDLIDSMNEVLRRLVQDGEIETWAWSGSWRMGDAPDAVQPEDVYDDSFALLASIDGALDRLRELERLGALDHAERMALASSAQVTAQRLEALIKMWRW